MKIGVVSDITGGADICVPVADLSTLSSLAYLAEGETVLFALSSPKEEYAFTNEALVTVCGGSAASTKRSVLRFEYQSDALRGVRFETCGVTDRDCELKFTMGAREFSIDVAKAEQPAAQRFFRVLLALARAQQHNARQWEFAKQALDAAVRSTTTTSVPASAGGEAPTALVVQANAVHAWYNEVFQRTNPRCYRGVLETALSAASAPISAQPQ